MNCSDAIPGPAMDGHHLIPAISEDRYESIYRNPVGAQSGYEFEGQREGTAVPLMRRVADRGEPRQSKPSAAIQRSAKKAA
jgi:hypothetical protein